MTAVWRVARGAVRRRRLQTVVIGVVVGVSTATIVLALGLLAAASAPFDRAHAQQGGAHLVAAFDRTAVSAEQLTAAAGRAGVEAVAGPFDQVALDVSANRGAMVAPTLNAVGRADPGGPVDRVNVWRGRWVAGPGEVVLDVPPGSDLGVRPGERLDVQGGHRLTVVGLAHSVSDTADAWVTPDQLAVLRPTDVQVLYRLTRAATPAEVDEGLAAVTAGLPPGALLGSRSYLMSRQQVAAESGVYVPLLVVFGVLGVAVAVLIVANVVSGAVVAGVRHIGVLKSIGFTPNQVMAVYLVMVTAPAAVGCVLGAVLGNVAARPVLAEAFEVFGATDIGVGPLVNVVALLGMPAVVALAALLPALRARRLSAAEAISAGSAPRAGRALAVQRLLGGALLPRAVSLGLGLPFARPARSALTLAAVALGVMAVTLAIGLTNSVTAYEEAVRPVHDDRVELVVGKVGGGEGPELGGPTHGVPPVLGDAEDEAVLRALPGAVRVAATSRQLVRLVGGQDSAMVLFYRGDAEELGPRILSGRRPDGPGQLAVPSRFLNQHGLRLGDTLTVELGGQRARVEVVGVALANSAAQVFADWDLLELLAPGTRAGSYHVQLEPGADRRAYAAAAAAADPGLAPAPPRGGSSMGVVVVGAAVLLTLVLGAVAALGVFNTVALNARERRRDLGVLKSIGMTPRQVVVMMVTSMGALGLVGGLLGLPLGVAAHHVVAPAMMRAAQADVLDVVVDVYRVPVLVLPALAGVAIAVLGAFLPALAAARTTIAEVLHNE
ncbi:ABC transporter permease [Saccharothrix xinjiangensis]|uniref:ABC transporter permease n=1 Tax=Saccharothrix xinjiangensis TaxID=204798 RepID=UPI0031E4754F